MRVGNGHLEEGEGWDEGDNAGDAWGNDERGGEDDDASPARNDHQGNDAGDAWGNDDGGNGDGATGNADEKPKSRRGKRKSYRSQFTLGQKIQILDELDRGGGKQEDVAKRHNTTRHSIIGWRKNRARIEEEIEQLNRSGKTKLAKRTDGLIRIKLALKKFYQLNQSQPNDSKVPITGGVISTKALTIRDTLLEAHAEKAFLLDHEVAQMQKFTASESWATQFSRDQGWKSKVLHNEVGGVEKGAVQGEIHNQMNNYIMSLTQTNPQSRPNPNKNVDFLDDLRTKYPHQPIFLQAVEEMALTIKPLFHDPINGDFYRRAFLFLTEPERMISFHVPWMDDGGQQHVNRGWRVEFSSALGPCKGGLRFHPTVNDGILKFLGFEQIFKNALTGLPLGGGTGGSDFDPKGKSEAEMRRFCESFMTQLNRYIGASTDVPTGDIGVGGREIGFMTGQYKRLSNLHGEGILTGKSPLFGGIEPCPEATGFGTVYIALHAVEDKLGGSFEGARCAVSGSGNVAQYVSRMLIDLGAKVVSISDSNGCLVFENGMTEDDFNLFIEAKQVKRARLSTLDGTVSGRYVPGGSPWRLPDLRVDFAFPSATQNEIDEYGASLLMKKGVLGVFEGANLPVTREGQVILRSHPQVVYIPGKAANAGGVGVSGLEMSQNASRAYWKREKVHAMLKEMMLGIYQQMKEGAGNDGTLEQGCNRAGFLKAACALRELGWVY